MTFEWDEGKNRINKKKHDGISFELAVRVFLIGKVEDILFVVYVEVNSRIRIISARKADKEEIDEYYRNYDLR